MNRWPIPSFESRTSAPRHLAMVCIGWFFLINACATASVLDADPSNYHKLLRNLSPGDILLLQPGEYRASLPIHRLNGDTSRPIIISGPDHGPRAVFRAEPGRNTVSILNASYITIRNLELDGDGLPVDAVKCEGHADWAHHITLENLVIKGYGHDQQTVGISTKCPAWNWMIRNNTIINAGTGIYLGNSDGSAPFVAGLIEHNLVVDTLGYNLQIKHQSSRPPLPNMPANRSVTIIRHNVFSKAGGGATGGMARPNVLVGHWPKTGRGAQDIYEIYGNLFYQNPTEALFQGEGNVALYNNLFVNDHGDAIRIQPHNDIPRAVNIFYNTVVASGAGISVIAGQGSAHYVQQVAANVVFASRPIVAELQEANVTGPREKASDYLARPFAALGEMDLYPKVGKLTFPPVDSNRFRLFTDWDRDFNWHTREGRFCGAYSGEGRNPGWLLQLERKPQF